MTLLACFFLFVGGIMAQTKVSGTVTSAEDGEPVIGAAIKVVGTSTGTLTDTDGRFTLNVPAGSKLTVSYIGMQTQTLKATPNMRIVLSADNKTLDEVMVVAYGTQKKSTFTGSAAVVDAKDIEKVQVTNAVDALKGKAAGIQINTASGMPGSTPTIRVRGINSINAGKDPLIVVDGSPYDGSLNNINPADVETLTVLKDAASTALYGARGGNGVVLITTKSGKRGQATRITVDAKWGSNSRGVPSYNVITSPAKYYEMWYQGLYNYGMNKQGLSADEAWKFANANMVDPSSQNDFSLHYGVYTVPEGQTLIGKNGKLNPYATLGRFMTRNGATYYLTPDKWDDAIYNNALRQEYTVSANGSTDRSTFYMSGNYLDNEGISVGSNYKRFTGRMKADYQLKPWLKIGGNANYVHYNQDYLGDDGSTVSSGNAFAMTYMAPIYPLYIRDGNKNIIYDNNSRLNMYDYGDMTQEVGYGLSRPYMTQTNPLSSNQLDTRNREGNSVNGVGTIEVRLPYGFKVTSINSVYLNEYRSTVTTNPFFGQYKSSNGVVSKQHNRTWAYNYQQLLDWTQTYGKHNIAATFGHEYYRTRGYLLYADKSNQFSVFNKELSGAVVKGSSDSYTTDYNDERYLGRVNYDFDGTYFVSGSYTREASSNFAPKHRWGSFWALGLGWMINKEKWFNVSWVDELKLKASYGENGNDQIGSYRYITTYDITNSNDQVSLVPRALGNEEITWEKNAKFNIGADFSLFGHRLYGSIEYYGNKTRDMLMWFPLPASFGYTGYYSNVGNVLNDGVEIDIHGDIIRTKDLTWTVNANLTSNHNEITKLPAERRTQHLDYENQDGYSSSSYFYTQGSSIYSYYTKKYAGVDPQTGESLWYKTTYKKDEQGNILQDANGHNVVDGLETTSNYSSADTYNIGDVMPDVYGGFGTSVNWKGIDFSIDFTYQLGGKVYDGTYAGLMSGNDAGYGMHTDLLNAWTTTNTTSNIPRIQYGDSYTAAGSDRFLTSASYLSLQNITLGYTLPSSWTRGLGINSIRIYGVADNVWVWSKRQGLDPRQSISGGSTSAYYSAVRTISGGITVNF